MVAFKMQFRVFSVLLLNLLYNLTSSLYFHIRETEKKCFIEKITDDTMITVNYRAQLYDEQKEEYLASTQAPGMFLEVKDPNEKVILPHHSGSQGRITFTSGVRGEHQICLRSNSSKFSLFTRGMLRVYLDIQVADHSNNHAAEDKLTKLQLRVRQLVEQLDQIQKELNYQRYREERFRQTCMSTSQMVLWWSIIKTLLLLATCCWLLFIRSQKGQLLDRTGGLLSRDQEQTPQRLQWLRVSFGTLPSNGRFAYTFLFPSSAFSKPSKVETYPQVAKE